MEAATLNIKGRVFFCKEYWK